MTRSVVDSVERDGYAILPHVVSDVPRTRMAAMFDDHEDRAGCRAGLQSRAVRDVATSPAVAAAVEAVLGPGAFAIRATLFDKTTATNWLVPWHQDLMIPVRERSEVPGFEAWSTKDGIPYVRPPARILASMLAVRIDLDGSTEANGPLRVIPGTHASGVLDAAAIEQIRTARDAVDCLVPRGGALLMRPLLLHASSRARTPSHRRIVHLEFATGDLPLPLEWHDRCAIDERGNAG